MTKLAIVGASGRMGGALIRGAVADSSLQLVLALERSDSASLQLDAGDVAGAGTLEVAITDDVLQQSFDVMIDFSTPTSSCANLEKCISLKKAIVIGTTGMSDKEMLQLHEASKHIPVFFAANMSVGVNVTLKLLELAARALGQQTDIEVIEAHHKHKVDAPSGTALKMGEVLALATNKQLPEDGVFVRHGHTGARQDGAIGFSTIRGGDIAGEHTVMFIGESERVEISHKATDRKIFAEGALRAAKWLAQQSPGLYGMNELLGFD